jgi:hypothetical protein
VAKDLAALSSTEIEAFWGRCGAFRASPAYHYIRWLIIWLMVTYHYYILPIVIYGVVNFRNADYAFSRNLYINPRTREAPNSVTVIAIDRRRFQAFVERLCCLFDHTSPKCLHVSYILFSVSQLMLFFYNIFSEIRLIWPCEWSNIHFRFFTRSSLFVLGSWGKLGRTPSAATEIWQVLNAKWATFGIIGQTLVEDP